MKVGPGVNIKLTNEQKTVLDPQMQQSMKQLRMGSHELEAYINEPSMPPLIEIKPPRERVRRDERASGYENTAVGTGSDALALCALGLVRPHGYAAHRRSCFRKARG